MITGSRKRRAAALALSLLLTLTLLPSASAAPTYQETIEKKMEWQDRIDKNREQSDTLKNEAAALQEQVDALQDQVEELQAAVEAYDVQIEELELQLEIANQELDDRYMVYCARVREIEERGKTSYWSILFSASSLQDLLGRLDYVEEIMRYDENALYKLEAEIAQLDSQAERLNAIRADRNYSETQLRVTQNKLLDRIALRLEEIAALEAENEGYLEEINRLTTLSLTLLARNEGKDYAGSQDPAEIYQRCVVESGEARKTPLGAEIVAYTLQFNGGEYVWGGASPSEGFDCSGMMYYVYMQFGYDISRTARPQYAYDGRSVSFNELQAGDMVFFHKPGETEVAHVGMYIGEGLFIHAASRKSGIKVSDLHSAYFSANYKGAKRVIEPGR